MKFRFLLTMIVWASVAMFNKSHSQTVESPYEVGTWQGFRTSAVTYTFDDQCSNQFTKAVPLFDRLNFKATFYPVINWGPDWSKIKAVADSGHEVGSHSMSHPQSLAGMANEENEYKNSQAEINRQVSGNQCITISYPNCNAGSLSLLNKYFIAGRKCDPRIESKNPADFFGISSFICGSTVALNTVQTFNSKVDEADRSNGWCVFLVHGIDNDGGYSSLNSSVIEGNLNYLNENKEKFWVSTFSNVVRYIKERNSVNVKEISVQNNSITLQITDNLPDSIYNYPITIRRPLPSGWDTAVVSQSGNSLASSVVNVNSKEYVMFDVVPDNGDVILKQDATSIHNPVKSTGMQKKVRICLNKSSLMFDAAQFSGSGLNVVLCDLRGAAVARYRVEKENRGTGFISLPVAEINHSIYIVQISDGITTFSQKCILDERVGYRIQ